STRVHEDGAFLVVAGGDPVERLAHVHVPLVGVDHEAGVGEAGELFAGAGHHPGVGVTHVGDGDTGTEVDEPVAVHVFNDAAAGPHHVDRQGAAYSLSDGRGPALLQRTRPGTGDLGDEPTFLGEIRVLASHGSLPSSVGVVGDPWLPDRQ